MPDRIKKIKDFANRLNLKQRMLLVYLIGCVLPICVVYFYSYYSTRDILVEQEVANESEKLKSIVDELRNTLTITEEMSLKFYFNKTRRMLVVRRYSDLEDIYVETYDNEELKTYLETYYPLVEGINVYLFDAAPDEDYFIPIDEDVTGKSWFNQTINNNGLPCWSYVKEAEEGVSRMRLSKVIYDETGERSGVISISLKHSAVSSIMERKDVLMLMGYNNSELILSNEDITQADFDYIRNSISDKSFSGWLDLRSGRSFVVSENINARYSQDSYNIITIKSYDEVLKLAKKNAAQWLVPMLIAILLAGFSVVVLSNWILRRIAGFSYVMHEAAKGNFDERNTRIGYVRDEIWELNEDLNRMIEDIQRHMDEAVREKVQKEQLYSRQKDVEFKMLATQINPHFLYNTLENIRMLARINKQPEIEDIAVTLNKLLRRSLNAGQNLETLMWEMEMVENYVKIQNYRFGDRIRTEISFDRELAEKYMVIPLVVQPFVENAYVHALEDKESDGVISIRVEIDELLSIYIEDNGHGMSKEKLKEITHYINDFNRLDRTHIGICNVNQRIKLRFGGSFGVYFDSVENVGTKVMITMPLIAKS